MMILQIKNKKFNISLNLCLIILFSVLSSYSISAKNNNKEENKTALEDTQINAPKKNTETGKGGVSYYEKPKNKAKEPHKNTKARGPMDPSNRQGEGLQNVNGSRE